VQPTIRLAVADRVAYDPEPCACGRPTRRLRAVEGRADDVLQLPGRDGRPVPVHPLQFAPVAQAREVREFQIVQRGTAVRVRVALRNGADREALAARLTGELQARLSTLGVADPQVGVEFCDGLERDPARMGKVQLVVADGPA
jgi:phenylacetate-coenzyme A ligase PaaK-like adenylate-forming protein